MTLREVFGQATKRSEKRHTRQELETAVSGLRPDIVQTLARFSGQTLAELDATFELLPIGTRLALERIGALQLLDDDGGSRFGVKALPISVDLVQVAAEQVLSVVPADILAGQLAAAADAQEALIYPLQPVADANEAGAISPSDQLGSITVVATTLRVDARSKRGWLQLLDPADPDQADSLPEVVFGLDRASGRPRKGTQIEVVFSVIADSGETGTWGDAKAFQQAADAGMLRVLVRGHDVEIPTTAKAWKSSLNSRLGAPRAALATVTSVQPADT